MTFLTDLNLMFTTEKVKQWSNAGNNTEATVADTAVIDFYERLTKGRFDNDAGVPYDETIDKHLIAAMDFGGVLLRIQGGELSSYGEEWDRATQSIRDLRRTTHSDTVTPEKVPVNKTTILDLNESAFDLFTLVQSGFPTRRRNFIVDSFRDT